MSIYSKTATPASIRRKANGLKFKKERERIAAIKDIKPVRDPAYLDWIRTLPCVVCCIRGSFNLDQYIHECRILGLVTGCVFRNKNKQPTEASHHGVRGLRQKASDMGAIPLCSLEHHREGKLSTHKLQKVFFDHYRIDHGELSAVLNAMYDEQR